MFLDIFDGFHHYFWVVVKVTKATVTVVTEKSPIFVFFVTVIDYWRVGLFSAYLASSEVS
jgi:hypothetical protein